MKTHILNFILVMSVAINVCFSQVKKEWYLQLGYSLSAQTMLDYSEPQLTRKAFSYFRFSDFRQCVNFFYIGAEQQWSISENTKSKLVWGTYFAKKGYKNNVSFVSSGNKINISKRYSFYYINFPLYIQRKLWQDKLFLNYGIVPSVMLYNLYQSEYECKVISTPAHMPEYKIEDEKHFYEKEVNFVDVALRLGLSYYLNSKIGFDFYYDKGTVNVNRNQISNIGYQNLWMLGLRYTL